jgi:hypothetical protein
VIFTGSPKKLLAAADAVRALVRSPCGLASSGTWEALQLEQIVAGIRKVDALGIAGGARMRSGAARTAR